LLIRNAESKFAFYERTNSKSSKYTIAYKDRLISKQLVVLSEGKGLISQIRRFSGGQRWVIELNSWRSNRNSSLCGDTQQSRRKNEVELLSNIL